MDSITYFEKENKKSYIYILYLNCYSGVESLFFEFNDYKKQFIKAKSL